MNNLLKLSAFIFFLLCQALFQIQAATITVNPGDNLNNKVKSAKAGDIVNIAPGNYGNIDITNLQGNVNAPIIIRKKPGTNGAVNVQGVQIQNGDPWKGVKALKAWNSSYLVFEDLTFRKGNEGIHLFNCDHIIFINCEVTQSGNAAIKFSHNTKFVDWLGGRVFDNGKLQGGSYGECFYIGQAQQMYDKVNNIWVEGVEIFNSNGGEAIDVKSEAFRVTVKDCNIHDIEIYNRPGDHSNRGAIQVLGERRLASEQRDYDAEVWIENVTLNRVRNQAGNWENGADAIFFSHNPGITVKNTTISNIDDAAFRAFGNKNNYLAEIDNFSKNNASNVGSVQNFGGGTNVNFLNNVGNNPMSRQTWYDGGDIIVPPVEELECETANPSTGLTPDLITVSAFESPNGPCNLMDGDLNTRWSANNAGGGSSGDVKVAIKNVSASSFESKANGGFDDFFPEFGIDGNTGTSWRAEGHGEWLMIELHQLTNISSLGVWFFDNGGRKYTFSIQVKANSSDNWETIVNHKQSVQAAAYEYLSINREVKYIRLLGYGNTNSNFSEWINVGDLVPYTSPEAADGQTATFDLGSVKSIDEVQIAFHKGNNRVTFFDLQVSTNGTNYTNVLTNKGSSGNTLNLESFTFPSQNARYVRYVGKGNTENTWNSVTEFVINSGTPPQEYTLNVSNGNGDGNYTEGTVVNISADAPQAGFEFDAWTGDVAGIADVNDATTTIIIPAENTSITATYSEIPISTGPENQWITITSLNNNKLCFTNNTNTNMIAGGNFVGDEDLYWCQKNADNTYSFRNMKLNKWLQTQADGKIRASKNAVSGSWEKFEWIDNADGSFSLRSKRNNKIVAATPGNNFELRAEGNFIGLEDKYQWAPDPTGGAANRKAAEIGIQDSNLKIIAYPNPASDILTIEGNGKFSVKVFDLGGKMVLDAGKFDSVGKIDISKFKQGIYFLNLVHNGERFSRKLLIQ